MLDRRQWTGAGDRNDSIRAGRVRELTRSSPSNFKIVWRQFNTVQLTSEQFVWKARSVHLIGASNFETFSKLSPKFTQFSPVRRSVQLDPLTEPRLAY